MKHLRHIPILKLVLPLIVGISCSSSIGLSYICLIAGLALLLITLLFLQYGRFKQANRNRSFFASTLLLLSFFFIGILFAKLEFGFFEGHYIDQQSKEGAFLARVSSHPEKKTSGFSFTVNLHQNLEEDKRVSGKVDCYLADTSCEINKGTWIIFNAKLNELESPDFPFEFNFSSYKLNQGIKYRAFLSSKSILHIENVEHVKCSHIVELRAALHKQYVQAIRDVEIRSFVEALVYANKEELSFDTKQSFSNVGVVHILAVSGLHVGIIYLILAWIFAINSNRLKYKWLRLSGVIVGIFLYAYLAGMGASVLRSGIMFSVLSIGTALKRRNHSLNSLCLAALIILIIKPSEIWAMGFQFSFLAVGGIVILNEPIRSVFPFNPFFNSLFDLISVSIAAQIATFPLALYYFHQFPNYFLLANVLVLPFVSIVLVLGILIPILGSIHPTILELLGNIESIYVSFIIDIVQWVESFPGALTTGIVLTKLNLVLCYLLLALLFLWIKYHKKSYAISLIIAWCAVLILHARMDSKRGILTRGMVTYRIIDKEHFEVRAPLPILMDERWRFYTLNSASIYYGRKAVLRAQEINLD